MKKKKRGTSRGATSQKGAKFRKDGLGKTYGGTIVSLNLNKAQSFTSKPKRPLRDADYSTAQMIETLAIETGFTAGSTIAPITLTATPTTNVFWAMAFSLQDLPQVATLTALFDQYRFDKVVIKFVPQSSSINVFNVASPNDTVPSVYAVLDFDDSTILASLNAALQYDNVQVVPYGQGFEITVMPSYTPAVFAAGAFSGYAVQKASWVDCANQAVAHYGVKGVFTALQAVSTSIATYNVYIKYYVSFRNTR